MSGFQKIKRQLLPFVKGLPWIIAVFVLSIFIARMIVSYTPNVYRSIAKVKLDDQKFGIGANNLYEDFDVFTTEQKVEAEAELMQSPLLLGHVIDSLDLSVSLFRVGRLKNTMLYDDSPILIDYAIENKKLLDHSYGLEVISEDEFILTTALADEEIKVSGRFNERISLPGAWLKITRTESDRTEGRIELIGKYEFKIFSRNGLTSDLISRLDVKAVDKEIAVIRVVYTDEHPQRIADLTNTLCQAYIQDYITTKSQAARETQDFVDRKLADVQKELSEAEKALERFKKKNRVVNTLQETETGLREISKLKIQLINLEMNEQAVIRLQEYISTGDYFSETAINFGFGDLLLTELVKKMKLWQDERQDLLMKYTADSEQIIGVEKKIEEVKVYIKEAIDRNLVEIRTKRADIQEEVSLAEHMFDELPTREKDMHILEREFKLLENVYNFLSQKKIEASIAESVTHSFHRIIQPAVPSYEPISPNKVLITFVLGLLGLMFSIAFIYLRGFVQAKVSLRDDLESRSQLPIAGVIRHEDRSRDFKMMCKSLLIKGSIKKGNVIAIGSSFYGEGRSYIAENLTKCLIEMGYTAHTALPEAVLNEERFQELRSSHDFVIIDTPPTNHDITAVECMAQSDFILYLIRCGHTSFAAVSQADIMCEEYPLPPVNLVLNDAHQASNYNGKFVGSRFRDRQIPQGIWSKIKSYINIYITR